jgi:hypothetical protein
MGHRRKRCSPVGEAWGGGGRGARSSSVRSGGVRSGVTGSVGRRGVRRCGSGVAVSVRQCGVGREGGADARGVGRLGARGSVGLLGPSDGSVVPSP